MLPGTKAQFLDAYCTNMTKSVTSLKESADRIVTQHHKARERMQTFATKVKEVAAVESVKELKNAFTTIGTAVSSLEDDHRKRMAGKLEREFKAKADGLVPKLETQKKQVTLRNKLFADKIDKEKYLRKQNDKPAPKPAKVKKAQEDAAAASVALVKAEADLNASIQSFQIERAATQKKMFEELIAAELYFHARAMETLTAAFTSLSAINPDQAGRDIAENLANYDVAHDVPPGMIPLRQPNTPGGGGGGGGSFSGGSGGMNMTMGGAPPGGMVGGGMNPQPPPQQPGMSMGVGGPVPPSTPGGAMGGPQQPMQSMQPMQPMQQNQPPSGYGAQPQQPMMGQPNAGYGGGAVMSQTQPMQPMSTQPGMAGFASTGPVYGKF